MQARAPAAREREARSGAAWGYGSNHGRSHRHAIRMVCDEIPEDSESAYQIYVGAAIASGSNREDSNLLILQKRDDILIRHSERPASRSKFCPARQPALRVLWARRPVYAARKRRHSESAHGATSQPQWWSSSLMIKFYFSTKMHFSLHQCRV